MNTSLIQLITIAKQNNIEFLFIDTFKDSLSIDYNNTDNKIIINPIMSEIEIKQIICRKLYNLNIEGFNSEYEVIKNYINGNN